MVTAGQGPPRICMTKSYQIKAWVWIFIPFVKLLMLKSGTVFSVTTFLKDLWMLYLKFIYSEKATKFCKMSIVDLSYVVSVKSAVEISQNFVAFSEYMNFNPFHICQVFWKKVNICVKWYYHCIISPYKLAIILSRF